MSKPQIYQTTAIVIRKTRLGEADRILTLYTPHMGKIQGFARAVRKPKSKLSGHLEMLSYSQVTLVRGKNIDTITGSVTIEPLLKLKSDLDMLSCALYAAEMINQFTPAETEDPQLFDLFLKTLRRLPEASDKDLLLRHFELHLLRQAGYRPELEKCALCRNTLIMAANAFAPSAGGALCPSCLRSGRHYGYAVAWDTLGVMRFIQGGDWESVAAAPIDATTLDEAARLLRSYMRHLLERDLRSAAWLDCLKKTS
ncbi:MAG: DNA repair protein RecO [Dehalococcoidia bacterium]|nr:DNA repair protein RecO [Dehalococcoidia bacterium]